MADSSQPAIQRVNVLEHLAPYLQQVQSLGVQVGMQDRRLLAAALSLNYPLPQLQEAIQAASAERPLREVLREQGVLQPEDLARMWALANGLQFVNLDRMPRISQDLLHAINRDSAQRLQAVACYEEELPTARGQEPRRALWVALADPALTALAEATLVAQIQEKGYAELHMVAADPGTLGRILQRMNSAIDLLRAGEITGEEITTVEEQRGENVEDLEITGEDGPARQLFALIFTDAVQKRASDVHFEVAASGRMYVRVRVDGALIGTQEIPQAHRNSLLSLLKLTFRMDPTKRFEPQSGRATVQMGTRQIDLRGETLPSVKGETMTVRLLDQGKIKLDINDLGFSPYNLERFKSAYRRPQGAVLVTGPTGSGKSSTLYAALNDLISETVKIITIEDPVEYQLDGITQVQVNLQQDMTFEKGLRAALRSDPEVIMVGEIRDVQTGAIAMRAAQTGHLMLSTLHTNEAASAPNMIINMGVPAFVVADSLNAVVAQRLLRKLCQVCREPYRPGAEELRATGYAPEQVTQLHSMIDAGQVVLYQAREEGCNDCVRGYDDRIPVHEVLLVGAAERDLIMQSGLSSPALRELAVRHGMRPMQFDALDRFMQGLTTLEEVARVVSADIGLWESEDDPDDVVD